MLPQMWAGCSGVLPWQWLREPSPRPKIPNLLPHLAPLPGTPPEGGGSVHPNSLTSIEC